MPDVAPNKETLPNYRAGEWIRKEVLDPSKVQKGYEFTDGAVTRVMKLGVRRLLRRNSGPSRPPRNVARRPGNIENHFKSASSR